MTSFEHFFQSCSKRECFEKIINISMINRKLQYVEIYQNTKQYSNISTGPIT